VVIVFLLYSWMARDAPDRRTPVTWRNYALVLKDHDTWWFMFFYSITFGGFVGLSCALPLYFTQWYHASGIAAGVSVVLSSLAFFVQFAVGGNVDLPLGSVLAAMVGVHTLVGVGEGVITAATVGLVLGVRPDLVYGARDLATPLELKPQVRTAGGLS